MTVEHVTWGVTVCLFGGVWNFIELSRRMYCNQIYSVLLFIHSTRHFLMQSFWSTNRNQNWKFNPTIKYVHPMRMMHFTWWHRGKNYNKNQQVVYAREHNKIILHKCRSKQWKIQTIPSCSLSVFCRGNQYNTVIWREALMLSFVQSW